MQLPSRNLRLGLTGDQRLHQGASPLDAILQTNIPSDYTDLRVSSGRPALRIAVNSSRLPRSGCQTTPVLRRPSSPPCQILNHFVKSPDMTEATFDPLVTSVARQASARQVLRLPWHTRSIALGSFFSSETASATKIDPFAKGSAFDNDSLQKTHIVFNPYDGDASFKSCESTSSSTSTDHLSVGIGVGISCFVVSASVSCQYDRHVMENNDSSKTSIMTTYRAGTVTLARPPKLSQVALQTLKYNGGLVAFKKRWGDYYVAGYRIGGDSGVMMSIGSHRKNTSESVTISIKVKVLFFTIQDSWSKSWSQAEADLRVTLSCFSTVEGAFVQENVQLGNPKLPGILQQARSIHQRAQGLTDTIQRKLDQIGVSNDKSVTIEQCAGLCKSGVVVELLLYPVENLRELQYWKTDTNVICM
ncbi:hypothetical protein FALBO_13326 [Fusarium albosuccineum]|uniref:Uncharacterized protein n=1 Tax=Fusarium albosuccineum TaxID=1237068 RepID=A0A8H4KYS5_9HYPO|nr:hypothetical protein FALBO_13326 [Fusarium albosuccineum]